MSFEEELQREAEQRDHRRSVQRDLENRRTEIAVWLDRVGICCGELEPALWSSTLLNGRDGFLNRRSPRPLRRRDMKALMARFNHRLFSAPRLPHTLPTNLLQLWKEALPSIKSKCSTTTLMVYRLPGCESLVVSLPIRRGALENDRSVFVSAEFFVVDYTYYETQYHTLGVETRRRSVLINDEGLWVYNSPLGPQNGNEFKQWFEAPLSVSPLSDIRQTLYDIRQRDLRFALSYESSSWFSKNILPDLFSPDKPLLNDLTTGDFDSETWQFPDGLSSDLFKEALFNIALRE